MRVRLRKCDKSKKIFSRIAGWPILTFLLQAKIPILVWYWNSLKCGEVCYSNKPKLVSPRTKTTGGINQIPWITLPNLLCSSTQRAEPYQGATPSPHGACQWWASSQDGHGRWCRAASTERSWARDPRRAIRPRADLAHRLPGQPCRRGRCRLFWH